MKTHKHPVKNLHPFNALDFLFNGFPSVSVPVNVQEKDDSFQIEVSAPGYSKDQFKVKVNRGVLTVSSSVERDSTTEKHGYSRREFRSESFSRQFALPDNVLSDEISANYKNGILTLSIPKAEKKSDSKFIEIQ